MTYINIHIDLNISIIYRPWHQNSSDHCHKYGVYKREKIVLNRKIFLLSYYTYQERNEPYMVGARQKSDIRCFRPGDVFRNPNHELFSKSEADKINIP